MHAHLCHYKMQCTKNNHKAQVYKMSLMGLCVSDDPELDDLDESWDRFVTTSRISDNTETFEEVIIPAEPSILTSETDSIYSDRTITFNSNMRVSPTENPLTGEYQKSSNIFLPILI